MHYYDVTSNKKLTASTRLLTLSLEDGSEPLLYQPGQYAAIGMRDRLRPTVMRCFSITTAPTDQSVLQFSMRIQGRYTRAIERLKPGDRVAVRGPFGGFVFNANNHKDIVMFAGGIGVAPFISMIRYASQLGLSNSMHLVYSCRDQNDIPFFDEITALISKNPNLKVTFVIGSGDVSVLEGLNVINGKVDDASISQLALKYRQQTYFICGPPPYMRAVSKLLTKHNVKKSQIVIEAFSQGSHPQTGKLRSWPFNVYALGALSLVVSGFMIITSDLYATIPKLEAKQAITDSANKTLPNGDISNSVNSVEPQVDTNINQKKIVKEEVQPSQQSTATTAPSTQSSTTLNTSPTTTTSNNPKTTVS